MQVRRRPRSWSPPSGQSLASRRCAASLMLFHERPPAAVNGRRAWRVGRARRPTRRLGSGVVGVRRDPRPPQRRSARRPPREVVRQIGDAGLRTVRLIVVDQHGIPRAKNLSGDALVSALENGSDFSGAIYSLDIGQRRVPAAVRRGRRLRHRRDDGLPGRDARPRPGDVPRAAVRRSHGLDPVGPVLLERQAGAARRTRAPAPPARPPCRARPRALCRHRGRALRHAAGVGVGRVRRDGPAGPAGRGARGRADRARLPVPLGQPHGRLRRDGRGDPRRARSTSASRRARSRTSGGPGRSRSRSARWRASLRPTR